MIFFKFFLSPDGTIKFKTDNIIYLQHDMFYLICLQIEMMSFTIIYRTFYIANFIVSKYMKFYIVFVLQVTTANGSREATLTVYLLFEPASWSTPGKLKRRKKSDTNFL